MGMEGCYRKEWGKLRARGGLLTHLGLQCLQPLCQLRYFAAVETTCGQGEAGLRPGILGSLIVLSPDDRQVPEKPKLWGTV